MFPITAMLFSLARKSDLGGLNLRIWYPHFTIMFNAIVVHVNVRKTLSGAHKLFEVSFFKN